MSHKTKKILEWSILSFFCFILIVSGLLLYYQKSYAGKNYPNVKIAGLDVSGKTKKQAEFILKNDLETFSSQTINLTSNDQTVETTMAETGLSFDVTTAVERAYEVGRSNRFIPQLWFSVKAVFDESAINVPFKINQEVFDKFVAEKVPALNIPAQNASLKIENGIITETIETNGQTVDASDLASQLLMLASNRQGKSQYIIDLKATTSSPEVTLVILLKAKTEAEQLLAKKISFVYEDKTYSPSRSDIGKWISFEVKNSQSDAALSDNAIKTYLNVIAKNIDITKKDKRINAVDNSVIEEGREGKYVDKDAAIVMVKNQINSSSTVKITLITRTEAPKEVKIFPAEGVVPGRFEGKYVDIDLAQQKLCMIESSSIGECFIISSGKPSMPTPTGTFAILNKNPRAWSAAYGLWMPYWQAFKGSEYGLHELPEWPGGYKEGQDHLGTPVSHGCVRLGVGSAATLFNWTAIGTPVYIHK